MRSAFRRSRNPAPSEPTPRPAINIESTIETWAVVTPNCAIASRSQISSYRMPQKPEMKKNKKYQSTQRFLRSKIVRLTGWKIIACSFISQRPPRCSFITGVCMRLKIEKLVYGGDGLARLPADEHGPGKTVFVPFVLEGEEVDAVLAEQKAGFARASLNRVTAASPDRVEPDCKYFQRCGGCHYQHASYEHQLKIKAEILRETLRRTAKVELPCELQIHPSPEWGYRNRTRLKVQTAPEFALGYYRLRSHQLLPVEHCPISSPLINRAMVTVWERGRLGEITAVVRELELFADHADEVLLVEAYCEPRTSPEDAQATVDKLASIMREVKGAAVFELPPANQFVEPKRLAASGSTTIVYRTKRAGYRVSTGAFFQTNRFLIDELA